MSEDELKKQQELLNKIQKTFKDISSDAERWYNYHKDVNNNLDGYLKGVKKLSDLGNELRVIEEDILNLKAKEKKASKEEKEIIQERLSLLEKEKNNLEKKRAILKEVVKDANKWNMAIKAAGVASVKAVSNLDKLPGFVTGKLGLLKGLFEMDKAIRMTVTQMGALGSQSKIVRENIKSAAIDTQSFGAGVKEIAEAQAKYAESLGRNVVLSQKSLESIAEIGYSSGIGMEGATEMAIQFDKMGVSADKAGKFMQETLDNSSAMGLNTTKVMKNINQNFKMLNKYRFKDGIKGLIKMGQLSTKLGVDMDFASGMADKLWDVEGAVEMSAQLQVMGGAWAQLADPFKLMYMARNDMEALTENIAKAAASSMSFNKDGSIQTNAKEMHRLKIIAQQTGLEYEKLVELGKTQFKMGKIEMQSSGLPDDVKEFVANTAEFKDGKAYIQVESGKKLLTQLNETDRKFLQTQVAEKKAMKDRADEAQSFDEKITNLINMVKIAMLPIVEGLTKGLEPLIKTLNSDGIKEDLKSLGKTIGEFVEWAATGVGSFVKTIVDIFGPKGLFIGYLAGKAAIWIANGLSLAAGFKMGTGGMFGGGGVGGGKQMYGGKEVMTGSRGGRYTLGPDGKKSYIPTGATTTPAMSIGDKLMGKNVLGGKLAMGTMGSMAAGAGLGIAGYGADKLRDSIYGEGSEKGKGLGVASSALKGAGMGMMFGPWGAAIGGLLGAGYGIYDEYFNKPQSDAKFQGLGSNHNKGRAIIQGGKITPIDNKDDVLAMKPGGMIDKTLAGVNNNGSTSKIEFGELNITGEIKINIPGTTQMGVELAKNPEFKSAITRAVTSQLEKNLNGGKNRG
jgi:hypothetical protein